MNWTKWTRGVFLGGNLLVATMLLVVLSRQLGAGELAIGRGPAASVTAALGEGWFSLERHGRDVWVWSPGAAELHLHVGGRNPASPVALRFALRGLGERTVTIRTADRVLWRGALGSAFVQVEIAGLELPAGTTPIEFSTDAPGVAESAAAGARALAFAVYNVELR
jgi:hypothetical protein